MFAIGLRFCVSRAADRLALRRFMNLMIDQPAMHEVIAMQKLSAPGH